MYTKDLDALDYTVIAVSMIIAIALLSVGFGFYINELTKVLAAIGAVVFTGSSGYFGYSVYNKLFPRPTDHCSQCAESCGSIAIPADILSANLQVTSRLRQHQYSAKHYDPSADIPKDRVEPTVE